MSDFANPMPVCIISELLGVPQAIYGTFVEASRAIAGFRGNPNRTVEDALAAQGALHRADRVLPKDCSGTATQQRERPD